MVKPAMNLTPQQVNQGFFKSKPPPGSKEGNLHQFGPLGGPRSHGSQSQWRPGQHFYEVRLEFFVETFRGQWFGVFFWWVFSGWVEVEQFLFQIFFGVGEEKHYTGLWIISQRKDPGSWNNQYLAILRGKTWPFLGILSSRKRDPELKICDGLWPPTGWG